MTVLPIPEKFIIQSQCCEKHTSCERWTYYWQNKKKKSNKLKMHLHLILPEVCHFYLLKLFPLIQVLEIFWIILICVPCF